MQVGEQHRGPQRRPGGRSGGCRWPPRARRPVPRSRIKGWLPFHLHQDAGRVAPVTAVLVGRARARAPDSEEGDPHRKCRLVGRQTGARDYPPGHGSETGDRQRRRLRLSQRRAGRRTPGPVPARLPRHRPHLAVPAPPVGRCRVPRGGALHAWLRPDRGTRGRPLRHGNAGAGRLRAPPGAGRFRRRGDHRSRLGRVRHLRGRRRPARAVAASGRRRGGPPGRRWRTGSSGSTSCAGAGTSSSSRPRWPNTRYRWRTSPSSTGCGPTGRPGSTARGTRPR